MYNFTIYSFIHEQQVSNDSSGRPLSNDFHFRNSLWMTMTLHDNNEVNTVKRWVLSVKILVNQLQET